MLKKIFCWLPCWCMGCGNHTDPSDVNEMLEDGDYGFIMQEGGTRQSSRRGRRKQQQRGQRRRQDDGYSRLLEIDYVPPADAQDESDADNDARPSDQKNNSHGRPASFVF